MIITSQDSAVFARKEILLLPPCLNFFFFLNGVKSELNLLQMLSLFLIEAMMAPTICKKKNVGMLIF